MKYIGKADFPQEDFLTILQSPKKFQKGQEVNFSKIIVTLVLVSGIIALINILPWKQQRLESKRYLMCLLLSLIELLKKSIIF